MQTLTWLVSPGGLWPNCLSRPLTICFCLWLTKKANISRNMIDHRRDFPWKHRYKFVCYSLHERVHHRGCKTHIHPRCGPPCSLGTVLQFSICKPLQNFCGGSIDLLPIYLFHWAINKGSHKALSRRVGNKTNPHVLSSSQYLLTSLRSREVHISPRATCGQDPLLVPLPGRARLLAGSDSLIWLLSTVSRVTRHTMAMWERWCRKHMIFATKQ